MLSQALTALVTALCLFSCYSVGDDDGDEDGSGGAAGASRGGITGRGGTTGGAGIAGRGGTTGRGGSAGSAGNGGSGALAGSGGSSGSDTCRNVNDCGVSMTGFFECVPPGAQPTQGGGCGAIDWCGQCSCGPMPQTPYGTGNVCDEVTACPTAETDPGFESYASVCDAGGLCTACEVDLDCPLEAPRCAPGRTGFGNECFECLEDGDCPELLPRCIPLEAQFGIFTPGGACRECATTADCAIGVCVEGACVAQCQPGGSCANEFMSCGAAQRCEPSPCTTAADCPTFGTCLDGGCVRLNCTADADCGGGACVNGFCFSGLGSCVEHLAAP